MHVVMGAQSCGFGPVSKLTAVARVLGDHELTFIGDTVAAEFARRNHDVFDHIVDTGSVRKSVAGLIASADWVVSVMDAELVFRAYSAGRPVAMVDSLFSFWKLSRPVAEIAALCARAPQGSLSSLLVHLEDLGPHDSIYAAHLLADHSILQNFPGVPERAAEAKAHCDTEFCVTGAIIDTAGLSGVSRSRPSDYDLLINVGGFKNFLLDFDKNNDYLALLDRWVGDVLADWPAFERILVCGGAYSRSGEQEVTVAGRRAEFRCLPQRAFLQEVGSVQQYMMTPGLTALHEAVQLEQLPLALPEQHYGHVVNLRQLQGTVFGSLGSSLRSDDGDYPMEEDDFAGTQSIVQRARQLVADEKLYQGFRRQMNTHIEAFLGVKASERARGVGELRTLVDGGPIDVLLHEIVGDYERSSRHRQSTVATG